MYAVRTDCKLRSIKIHMLSHNLIHFATNTGNTIVKGKLVTTLSWPISLILSVVLFDPRSMQLKQLYWICSSYPIHSACYIPLIRILFLIPSEWWSHPTSWPTTKRSQSTAAKWSHTTKGRSRAARAPRRSLPAAGRSLPAAGRSRPAAGRSLPIGGRSLPATAGRSLPATAGRSSTRV